MNQGSSRPAPRHRREPIDTRKNKSRTTAKLVLPPDERALKRPSADARLRCVKHASRHAWRSRPPRTTSSRAVSPSCPSVVHRHSMGALTSRARSPSRPPLALSPARSTPLAGPSSAPSRDKQHGWGQALLLRLSGCHARRVRAVAFDVDGVLIDSVAVHRTVWATWAQRHRLDVDVVWRATFGRRPEDIVVEVGRGLDPTAERRRLDQLLAAHEHGIAALPGARALLEQVGPRPWALATSGSRAVTTERFQRLGLPLPSVCVFGE